MKFFSCIGLVVVALFAFWFLMLLGWEAVGTIISLRDGEGVKTFGQAVSLIGVAIASVVCILCPISVVLSD